MSVRTVGVEEELLLVAPQTGQPRAVAGTVLRALHSEAAGSGNGPDGTPAAGDAADALESELQKQQLETNTRPCRSIDELEREVRRCRSWAAGDAGAVAKLLAAVLERGNGAAFQRGVYRESGDLRSVVTRAAALTAG
jgi:glutamate---cysteine ligase / carboxylate-amine ligase